MSQQSKSQEAAHDGEPEDDPQRRTPDDLRSREVTDGPERAPHRAMFRAMGSVSYTHL
ncbi:hypothetical protein [Halococcus saccharolyticus]|uniref:hypothetical protein n=1 Tax=Halococcus saccharolyticus TaxID=62319 RepID=UPI000AC96ACE|nr:hypothetical protein [Halococcus saccharolyticus]